MSAWKKLTSTEHQEQSAYFDWIRIMEQQDDRYKMIIAIPNAGKRSWMSGKNMKAEGLKAGVWDVLIAVPMLCYPGAWIEFKTKKNKLTKEQIAWGALISKQGYMPIVCYSADEAMQFTKSYFSWGKNESNIRTVGENSSKGTQIPLLSKRTTNKGDLRLCSCSERNGSCSEKA